MNKVLYIILISLFSLTVISCGEKEESTTTTGITYPSSGNYGDNLLRNESITISTSSGTYYSLRVEKEVGSIVKIIFPIPNDSSGNMWYWSSSPTNVSNWYEGSESSGNVGGNRIFITESRAIYSDMRISFSGSQSVNIVIYENGVTTATRTKTLSW